MHSRKTNFLDDSPRDIEETSAPLPSKRRRLFLILLVVGALFLTGCIGRTLISWSLPNDPRAYDPVTLEPLQPEGLLTRIKRLVFNHEEPLAGHKEDRINVLLLGMGGPGHDGPFLTDTMIIASFQPSTGEVAMISIPRDLGVNIPGHGWYKINHANAYGEVAQSGSGGALSSKVVSDTFGVDIHYYLRVDFKAVEDVIDDIDGITIDVETPFTDTEYPADNYLYQTISFKKGIQVMNGDIALKYARSRHGNNGEGSDFARAKRQQRMILALKEKVLSFETLANPIRIHNILDTLGNHISTNMNFSDIISMMKLAKQADLSNIKTVVLDTSVGGYLKNGYSPNGAFILAPTSGNFDEISALIEHIFDPETENSNVEYIETPAQEQPDIPITTVEVQNGTWRAGLAARAEKILEDDNIVVTTIGNTGERPVMESGIYILDPSGQTAAQAIKATLNIPIKKPTDVYTPTAGSHVLVILGEDFEE
jgi:LCP family protein required for cell wall assembly